MLQSVTQDEFNAGIVRQVEGQRIPVNGCYDIVNGLLDDDLAVYRRGGGSYLSTAVTGGVNSVVDVHTAGGQRTVTWGATHGFAINGATPVQVVDSDIVPASRGAGVAGMLALLSESATGEVILYAGSLKSASYGLIGTVSVTHGSPTVTGVGTAFTANVDSGMILTVGGTPQGIVQRVNSNTSITLRSGYPGVTAAGTGAYFLARSFSLPTTTWHFQTDVVHLAVAGSRLIVTGGSRDYFSARNDPFTWSETDFHELPSGGQMVGAEGIGDTVLLFATDGVWAVSNLAYDLTDTYGNVQHSVSKISDTILWGDAGIAGSRGGIVVPAIDDVYMYTLGGAFTPIGGAIRPLYRSYVKDGYKPGMASVYRSHYVLPILDGSNDRVDTLVCRLDGATVGWTRWDGHAASTAYAQQVGASTRQPKLLAVDGSRVLDVTACFDPTAANKNDADASTHQLTLITRDFAVRRAGQNLWKYLRARYELTDAATDNPYLTVEYQVGAPSDTWTTVSGNAPESDGTDDFEWGPDLRAQAIRFRIKSNGPTAKCVLRSLEVFFRPSAKR